MFRKKSSYVSRESRIEGAGSLMETLAIKMKNLKKIFGAKEILKIEELSVYQNDRIGIIGSNGDGKSTLLKIIKGELQPDHGIIQTKVQFNYFPQIVELNAPINFELIDWKLMSKFDVPHSDENTLSGGEERKYQLTQLLSIYQNGLLLDEPTTHLDSKSIQVLIDELKFYYGTLLFVSHDRYFLNELATKIWVLNDGKVKEYIGNFDDYNRQKEIEQLEEKRHFDQYQLEKKRLELSIINKKEQAKKSGKISVKKKQNNIKPNRLSSTKQKDTVQKNLQKSAKSLESRLNKLEERTMTTDKMKIVFPPTKTVEIHNRYPIRSDNFFFKKGNKLLFNDCDFQFELGKKYAIIGNNGSGKTSFLNCILANSNGIVVSPKAVFSYYQQMSYKVNDNRTILEYLMVQTEYSESLVRSILNNLGFSQLDILKPVKVLSGGEVTRVQIALTFIKPSNILILDEPTNFIDIKTIQALDELIKAYQGTVIFTSHDNYFIEINADYIYEINNFKLNLIS